uniref:Putative secreted protein n=1 Tax=Ixodes ricinus TaxID=34613 RepID=A0A6B0UP38_IXORI
MKGTLTCFWVVSSFVRVERTGAEIWWGRAVVRSANLNWAEGRSRLQHGYLRVGVHSNGHRHCLFNLCIVASLKGLVFPKSLGREFEAAVANQQAPPLFRSTHTYSLLQSRAKALPSIHRSRV